jgi:hypothetical protein
LEFLVEQQVFLQDHLLALVEQAAVDLQEHYHYLVFLVLQELVLMELVQQVLVLVLVFS